MTKYIYIYIYTHTQPSKSSCAQVRNILNLPAKLSISILLFKGLPLFGFLIFKFKNVPTPLCLSRDKAKE